MHNCHILIMMFLAKRRIMRYWCSQRMIVAVYDCIQRQSRIQTRVTATLKWPYVSKMAVRIQIGRTYPKWPYVSKMAVRIQNGRMYPKWPYVSKMAVRIQNGRTYPKWPYVSKTVVLIMISGHVCIDITLLLSALASDCRWVFIAPALVYSSMDIHLFTCL